MKHLTCAAVALTLATCATLAAPVAAETLKISSYLPPKHAFTLAVEAWGQELSQKTNGDITVEVFPAGQLGPVNRQFDLVTAGAADAAIVLHSATPGRFAMSELAGLPLSHPAAGDLSTISSERLTALAPDYLADEHAGTKIIWMAVTPPLKINLAKVNPDSLEALKGLRIRSAGQVFQSVLETLGASPLPVPPAEVAEGLAKGIVDGAMFPFEADMAFDLGPELDYSLEPGVASATFAFVMSEKTYDGLSPETRAVIDAMSGPARGAAFGAEWDKGENAGRAYLGENDVTIVTLSEAEQDKLQGMVAPIIDAQIAAVGKDNPDAQAFYDAYTQ
ncbi:Bacterial extracellular solute-binding protein, family 7 [Aquimixticola soesokkakensis]|uniref:Bacterial extracellular solute-binding protein, family 7 n=1 Tax=Aquimixticola soesokkakensis TaxID=1519096 RepID=A0A1Y5SYJ0_9RHOB|nr:TRAP transporter substrate-binding protein [Aquimixticola soesokkakensis]SLN51277.1 Bacterial extracellular solute-binding protein, family 7 [Aquimixticola soesokkakensis]